MCMCVLCDMCIKGREECAYEREGEREERKEREREENSRRSRLSLILPRTDQAMKIDLY